MTGSQKSNPFAESPEALLARIDERTRNMEGWIKSLESGQQSILERLVALEIQNGRCPDHKDMEQQVKALYVENTVLKTKLGMVAVAAAGLVTLAINVILWVLDKLTDYWKFK